MRSSQVKWSVGAGFTSQCNMACPFCYSRAKRSSAQQPLQVWKDFFSRYHDRIESVNYGTGENTLCGEWFELISFVRERFPGISQALTTNGHLAEAVADRGRGRAFHESIDEVDVSLDYADARRHDLQRGCPGAFRMALRTLELCHDRKVTIVMVGLEETLALPNLEALFLLARRSGAYVRINLYRPALHSSCSPPSYGAVTRALDWIVTHHRVVSISDPLFASLYGLGNGKSADPSGTRSLRILSDGSVTPCTYLVSPEWYAGSIDEEGILEKLPETRPFRALTAATLPAGCGECSLAGSCRGGAYDRRILFYGTLEARDPYCPRREPRGIEPGPRSCMVAGEGPSIHAGYLPTMIFKPGREDTHG